MKTFRNETTPASFVSKTIINNAKSGRQEANKFYCYEKITYFRSIMLWHVHSSKCTVFS